MAASRLHYFPLRGRGELIRLVHAYGRLPLDEVTVPLGRAFVALKPSLPFGQLPVMEIDGTSKQFAQSTALARYAAKRVGLYPLTDHTAALEVDMIVDTTCDIIDPITSGFFLERDAVRRDKNISILNRFTLPMLLGGIEARLPAEGEPFVLPDQISLADLAVFNVIANVLVPAKDTFPIAAALASDYPLLHRLTTRVAEVPTIAEYLSQDETINRAFRPVF